MIILDCKDLRHSLAERENAIASLIGDSRGGVLLRTCNRVEVYHGEGAASREVASHLFRVTAGLESAMLGENAVQGQVKDAYESARGSRPLTAGLHKLFQHALRVGKRVRSETNIARGSLSHAKAVLEILHKNRIGFQNANILLIGASNLNAHLVRYLAEHGGKAIYIANRTFHKAEALAKIYGGTALTFDSFHAHLALADIVISATSAPHYIIRHADYRPNKDVVMFDLAVPRDIEPSIGNHARVRLYNIEDVEHCVIENRLRRSAEILKAEEIISEELKGYVNA